MIDQSRKLFRKLLETFCSSVLEFKRIAESSANVVITFLVLTTFELIRTSQCGLRSLSLKIVGDVLSPCLTFESGEK